MKQHWQRLSARFDALSKRERMLIFAAAVIGLALIGYQLLIEPQLVRHAMLTRQFGSQQQAQAQIKARLAELQARASEPDAQNRAALQELRRRLAQAETEFRTVQDSLVPPERMATLLDAMLRKNRALRLVSLNTLPASPVVEKAETKSGAKGGDERKMGKPADGGGLYRHGVQITVRGSYADLLEYLAQLEKLPQKMYWGRVTLASEEYPVAVLQLTVYTLSLDKSWLVI